MRQRSYIVICAQVVGGNERPFEIIYGWDGEKFDNRQSAITHGLDIRGSDDFNLGILESGRLAEFVWMDQPMHASDADELPTIAKQIGLRCRAALAQSEEKK